MLKNTEKYERKTAQGTPAITQAIKEQKNVAEDLLVAKTKAIYGGIEPSNDNKQLNYLLYPPYTDKSKKNA